MNNISQNETILKVLDDLSDGTSNPDDDSFRIERQEPFMPDESLIVTNPQSHRQHQGSTQGGISNNHQISHQQQQHMQQQIKKAVQQIDVDDILNESQVKYPDSALNIHCETHNTPAVFYSSKHQSYKCFKCLIEEQELVYIDKRFKKEMEEFERIKQFTQDIIKENQNKLNTRKEWKNQIRQSLMEVRQNFLNWIDQFSARFMSSLKDIDKQAKDLIELQGEDQRLVKKVDDLRSKWNKIGEIYKSISTAPAEKKIDTIDKNIPLMEQIEEDVKNINQYIDRQSKRLRDALYKNIAIDGLSSKIEDKFLRFFERRINEPKGKATAPLDTQDNQIQNNGLQVNNIPAQNNNPRQTNNNIDVYYNQRSTSSAHLLQQQNHQQPLVQQPPIPSHTNIAIAPHKNSSPDLSQKSSGAQLQQPEMRISKGPFSINAIESHFSPITPPTEQQRNTKIQQQQQQQITQQVQILQQNKQQQQQQPERPSQKFLDDMNMNISEIQPRYKTDQFDDDHSFSILEQIEQVPKKQNEKKEEAKINPINSSLNAPANPYPGAQQQNASQTMNVSQMSRYRHKNQNSIYFLKPRSAEIYLLDFKKQGFVREQLVTQVLLPQNFSSMQLPDGHIYIIGGLNANESLLRNVLEINPNMEVEEKIPMKLQRNSVALTLLKDRYILALGGQASKGKFTDYCDVYDTQVNQWLALPNMDRARGNTSACVINQRFVYIFPGTNNTSWSTIEMLDIGYPFDIKNVKNKWNLMSVANSDFSTGSGYGSIAIGQNEILIFGNKKNQTFMLDTSDQTGRDSSSSVTKKVAKVELLKGAELLGEANFCIDSDFLSRPFGNFLYAVDCNKQNLHVYSQKDKTWNCSTLAELGVTQ